MGRAVTPVSRGTGLGAKAQAGEGDSSLEQLAKYFPIETGGPYLAISTVVIQSTNPHTTDRTAWLWIIFAALGVATVILLYRQYPSAKYQQRWAPIVVGISAFVIWAYASGGLAQEIGIYDRVGALVLPTLYALVASLYKPIKTEPAGERHGIPAAGRPASA